MAERPAIGGTGPMPRRSLPWQLVHCTVLPLPPVTSVSPLLMLPGGTYVVNPIRQSRSVVRIGSSGTSMMRCPIGSIPSPAPTIGASTQLPCTLVFGTIVASVTLYRCCDSLFFAKY